MIVRVEPVLIIGVDCATEDSKVGLAISEYQSGMLEVIDVSIARAESSALFVISEWIRNAKLDVLIALDAPLGWPAQMGSQLNAHQAGDRITVAPNDIFRRETDRFIQRTLRKTPLDVGADRIARTAHSALRLLDELRENLSIPLPLAWDADFTGPSAIEVYPGATLVTRGHSARNYKTAVQRDERERVVEILCSELILKCEAATLIHSADALDAVICTVAGKDFLDGLACRPYNHTLARKEGWIWTAPLP